MNRTWKLLCLPALLALTVMVLPVRADPEKPPTLEDQFKQLAKQLADQNKQMLEARDKELGEVLRDLNRRLKYVEEDLQSMKKRISALEEPSVKANGRQSNYPTETTVEQLRRLQESIDQLKNSRSSFTLAPETIGPIAPLVPARSTVRVQNTSLLPCIVTINGIAQRVVPGQIISVDVPAGVFTYEVVAEGSTIARRNTLSAPAGQVRDMQIF